MSEAEDLPVLDLTSGIEALPDEPRYVKLKGLAKHALAAASARMDLTMALEAANALADRCDPMKRGGTTGAEAAALMTQAILLYSRATKTSSDYRTVFKQIEGGFSPTERVVHDEICSLRDGAFAHFGTGRREGEHDWAEETLVLVPKPNGGMIASASRRATVDPFLVQRMTAHIAVALRKITLIWIEKDEQLVAAINGLKGDDLALQMLHSHKFDSERFVFSAQESARFDAVLRGGEIGQPPATRSYTMGSRPKR